MGYEISLNLAWDELERLALQDCTVSLLGENYQVRAGDKVVLSSSGTPAPEMQAVLILHYLIDLLKHCFHRTSEWISFKETARGKLFWPAFQESAIKPLVVCFQQVPGGLVRALQERLRGRRVRAGMWPWSWPPSRRSMSEWFSRMGARSSPRRRLLQLG